MYGFDPVKLAQRSDERIEALMLDPGIIRNRLKLKAARRNAQAWLAVDNPAEWLWSFVGGTPRINHFTGRGEVPAVTDEAKAMSKLRQPSRSDKLKTFLHDK